MQKTRPHSSIGKQITFTLTIPEKNWIVKIDSAKVAFFTMIVLFMEDILKILS